MFRVVERQTWQQAIYVRARPIVNGSWRRGETAKASKPNAEADLVVRDSCELTQVRGRDGLRAAPYEEEQCFAAPSPGRMADDVT